MEKAKRKLDGKKKDLIILIIIAAIAAVLLIILLASLFRRFSELFGGGWLSVLMFTVALGVIAFLMWALNRRRE
jgi:hypothetical protein